MNTPEKELSDSLLTACKAAGIESPKYIAQDKDESIYHYSAKPSMIKYEWLHDDDGDEVSYLDHPPYAEDWQDSLLEWVEPCINYIEDKSICDSYGEPKGQCLNCGAKDYEHEQGEPLADVLARHPDHVADTSKKVDNTLLYALENALDAPTGIEALVCADIAKRQQVGIAKYGTTVAENPLTHAEWLQHAYEECLDMAIYLKRAMAEKGGASD